MKFKVISQKNLPCKLPINSTMLWYLLFDKINAPGWGWGVYWTLFGILWITAIIVLVGSEQVDIFKDGKDTA